MMSGVLATISGDGWLIVYCVAVFGSSLLGGYLPSLIRLTHTRLQLLISLIGGLMIGVGLLHQLPHAFVIAADAGRAAPLDWCVGWVLTGLVVMFFMLRTLHFHHHEPFDPSPHGPPADATYQLGQLPPVITGEVRSTCGHDHDHDHDHDQGHGHSHGHGGHHHELPASRGAWIGMALGLSLHSLLDGLALGSHVAADLSHGHTRFVAVATFLGIFLHKPLDSLSIISLMTASGWSARSRNLVNAAYALMCPLGAALFVLGVRSLSGGAADLISAALAFSAGIFLCLALSDLLPEVEFHSHDRIKLSAAFLCGIVLAWGIGFLEPEHAHEHGGANGHSHSHDDHSHDGHSHDDHNHTHPSHP
ncbi:MAG: ZIP family metal transporter [Planctomycetaceae bacterium]|nr:ZIP family metal transporter [Planctomycetaceae bacterium]